MVIVGFYEDVYREELLTKAAQSHPNGLLVCVCCGWAWLTMETAKVANMMTGFEVVCLDQASCVRRQSMNLLPKSKHPGKWPL